MNTLKTSLERPFIVENLKQFVYCRRIVFFDRCMPGIRPRTFSMDAGREDHMDAKRNARRRSFSQMGFESGRREFDVEILDESLNLHGKLDEVVTTNSGEVMPVEYKSSTKISDNHRLQVFAYALLLEMSRQVIVERAYVYLIPLRKARIMSISPEDKQLVRDMLSELNDMIARESMPAPTQVRSRCQGCEFRRFCNDV